LKRTGPLKVTKMHRWVNGAGRLTSSGRPRGGSEPEPANQACVGQSLSALAANQPSAGSFGAAVVGFAQAPDLPGLGDGLQTLQAGLVPDAVVPNTCNG
jgi:hypothetical protein